MSNSEHSAGAVGTPPKAEQRIRRSRHNDTWEKLEEILDRVVKRIPDQRDRT